MHRPTGLYRLTDIKMITYSYFLTIWRHSLYTFIYSWEQCSNVKKNDKLGFRIKGRKSVMVSRVRFKVSWLGFVVW